MLNADVRLEWLVSFLAVVDTGSFVSAAESTHRSQPRVSMHVAALEREVGLPLFDRRKRPVELTEVGTVVATHARNILRALETAEAAIAPWRGGARGVVMLGCYPSASAAYLPAMLEDLAKHSPEIKVVLVERATLELDAVLSSGEADLVIRPTSPVPPSPSFVCTPLWKEPMVVLHPDDHPLADAPDPVEVQDLVEHPLISIGRLGATGASFEAHRLFRTRGFELEPVQATNQPQTLVSLVRRGLGIGVTNWLAAATSDTHGVRIRRIAGDCGRRVAVYRDVSRPLNPAARALWHRIRDFPRPAGTDAVTQHVESLHHSCEYTDPTVALQPESPRF